jgi:hypothetical protein
MGYCVTFTADDVSGILDDVATRATRRPRSLCPQLGRKQYWLHVDGDGCQAIATFHCRRCGHTHQPRNAHKLAIAISRTGQDRFTISR